MINSLKNLRSKISNIKPMDLVYPGIIFIFFVIVGVLFFTSTRFIAKNINDAFSLHPSGNESSLNMHNYTIVAKKLGFSTELKKATDVPITTTEQMSIATTTPQILDKKSLTLRILNGSPKSGVATSLATDLSQAGFQKAKIGDEKKTYATTTIVLKENKIEFSDVILKEVQKKYSSATISTTTNDVSFDATITIGEK